MVLAKLDVGPGPAGFARPAVAVIRVFGETAETHYEGDLAGMRVNPPLRGKLDPMQLVCR